LLDAVRTDYPALAAYFARRYYAGLRPAQALELRREDCQLPEAGWEQLPLSRSHQRAGAAWTDAATTGEVRGLKHRGRGDTRPVPAHPELIAALRRHLDRFPTGVEGHLFAARTGRVRVPLAPYATLVSAKTIYRVWAAARQAAPTEQQASSMLARRPYELRHLRLPTWLNAGVPPARVAEWAGHSVEVLLRIYTNCVDGDDQIALARISQAFERPIRRALAQPPAEHSRTDPDSDEGQPGRALDPSTRSAPGKTSARIPHSQPKSAATGRRQLDTQKGLWPAFPLVTDTFVPCGR
jgi:integrase